MTIVLSEKDVEGLLTIGDSVAAVEEAFRQQARSMAVNSPRTRSATRGSSLNVMHASLPYLGRAGVKCYLTSRTGSKFVFVLFDSGDGSPLAVMGANSLGRSRTGAASAVATRFMLSQRDAILGICGSGWQALAQVLALREVVDLTEVRVWSPTAKHRKRFSDELGRLGFESQAVSSPMAALRGADVGTAITSSREGFIDEDAVRDLKHLNAAGSNSSRRAEVLPSAVAKFGTVAVDDLAQARYEAGDLILAERAGRFTWDKAVELKDVVGGRMKPEGKTLFKSHGAAIEDVAVASVVYDRAVRRGDYADVELVSGR